MRGEAWRPPEWTLFRSEVRSSMSGDRPGLPGQAGTWRYPKIGNDEFPSFLFSRAPTLLYGAMGQKPSAFTRVHRHGETFRRSILALVRAHYAVFCPMLAAEKPAARHGLRLGAETLRQLMILMGCRSTVGTACPPRTSRVGDAIAWANWCRSADRNTPGLGIAVGCARCWRSSTMRRVG